MALLVEDCPRCGSKTITFDVLAQVYRVTEYGWLNWYEIFCQCRACHLPTIFLLSRRDLVRDDPLYQENALVKYNKGLNEFFKIDRYISLRDNVTERPPEHLPKPIEDAFNEAAACLSIGCNNAAATMFRLCIDLVTRPLLPEAGDSSKPQPPNNRTRRDLGSRLAWMFENGILPLQLRELARSVREDGNDGAHVGNLTKEDAEDLLDFTRALLDRLVTEPKKLAIAESRRQNRRHGKGG